MRSGPRRGGAFRVRFAMVCGAVCLVLLLVGCGKKKHITGPVPGPSYPALTSPQNVLSAMALAYMARDTIESKLVYDDNYQGTSLNQHDPAPVVANFTKADEIRHVATLAKSPTIAYILVTLRPALVRSSDSGDPPGWALIQNPIFQLEITDGPTSYDVGLYQETIEFRFIPTTPDATSPTDTTWKIIRWTEVAY